MPCNRHLLVWEPPNRCHRTSWCADISSVQAAEDRGVLFSDGGASKDILQILKDHGFNYIRLRVFVDPTQPTPRGPAYSMQGYCDLAHTITMAKRIKAAGMGLLIDFHYSDGGMPVVDLRPGPRRDLRFGFFLPVVEQRLVADLLQRWRRDAAVVVVPAAVPVGIARQPLLQRLETAQAVGRARRASPTARCPS